MAQLKDSLITGDLRVTGTIYGDVPLDDLVDANDLKAIEALSGSGIPVRTGENTWTMNASVAPSAHAHGNLTSEGKVGTDANKAIYTGTGGAIQAGTLPVAGGGTGQVTFTSGELLMGNGTNGLSTIVKTSANTANTVVLRDASGNFTAGTITATSFVGTGTDKATNSTTAPMKSAGGLAVAKNIWVGASAGASTTSNTSSQLIVSSNDTGSGGNVAIELWRGSNASWQFSNESGDLHFRTNYTTAKQTTYSVDAVKIAYNTGTVTLNAALPVTSGGTGTKTAPTSKGIIYATSASAYASTTAGTSGQLLQSGGANGPSWIDAASANTASAVVKRDASGNFSAGTITAALSGNASTATKWAAAQTVYVTLGTASTSTTIQGGSTSAQTIGVNGTLAITNGGTGATTAANARTNLGNLLYKDTNTLTNNYLLAADGTDGKVKSVEVTSTAIDSLTVAYQSSTETLQFQISAGQTVVTAIGDIQTLVNGNGVSY